MLQASRGRSGKQQQEQNSPNLGTALESSPAQARSLRVLEATEISAGNGGGGGGGGEGGWAYYSERRGRSGGADVDTHSLTHSFDAAPTLTRLLNIRAKEDRPHCGIRQPGALLCRSKAYVTDSSET